MVIEWVIMRGSAPRVGSRGWCMCFEKGSGVPSSGVRSRSVELTRGMGFKRGGGGIKEVENRSWYMGGAADDECTGDLFRRLGGGGVDVLGFSCKDSAWIFCRRCIA